MKRIRPRRVSFRVDPEQWSSSEWYNFIINPAFTGLGGYPTLRTPGAWVCSVIKNIEIIGEALILRDLLSVLRLQAQIMHKRVGSLTRSVPTVPITSGEAEVELPRPSAPAAPTDVTTGFTDREAFMAARKAVLNPVNCGIYPHFAALSDHEWIRIVRQQMKDFGRKQVLVDMLESLRQTYGCPGRPSKSRPMLALVVGR